MSAGRTSANNHLYEAMALLIRNQAAFVEQIARTDQERLALQRQSDERQIRNDAWRLESEERWRRIEQWQGKAEERFMSIEKRLIGVEERLKRIETVLLQLPQVLKKEIGFQLPK